MKKTLKKNIWYISKYFAIPNKNSPPSRGFGLIEKFQRQNVNCLVITSDSHNYDIIPKLSAKYTKLLIQNINFIWIKTFKYRSSHSFKRIISWIDFEIKLFFLNTKNLIKPDLIIVSSLSLLTIINGIFLKFKFKCKLVFEIRDIWPLTLTAEGGYSKFNPFILVLSLIEYLGYRYSDVIIGTMPNLKEHVENITRNKKNVFCIPMGIDLDSKHDEIKLDQGYIKKYIPKNKFIISYAGSIGISNNLDTFFETAKYFNEYANNIHFLIVGEGNLKPKFLKKYGYLSNLTFCPKITRSKINSFLKHSSLLYFSTHDSLVWKYGQSLNKLTDYMHSARPIIGSYSGYLSMINEANCGQIVENNNIKLLIEVIQKYSNYKKEELDRIGQNGYLWIRKNRSYEKLASDYLNYIFK